MKVFYVPLNWCSHSVAAITCPTANELTASGDSMHICRCGKDSPGILLHNNDAENVSTNLKGRENVIIILSFPFINLSCLERQAMNYYDLDKIKGHGNNICRLHLLAATTFY